MPNRLKKEQQRVPYENMLTLQREKTGGRWHALTIGFNNSIYVPHEVHTHYPHKFDQILL